MTYPTKEGYYWAKWHKAAQGTRDGEELTRFSSWEIVQVNNNNGIPGTPEEFSVSVPGVETTQWREGFLWGQFVAPLSDE